MTFEEYEAEWAKDCELNQQELTREALRIPNLHSKWTAYLNRERRMLHTHRKEVQELEYALEGYFSRTLTMQEMEKYGFGELPDKKTLKPDMSRAIGSHPKMMDRKLRLGQQQDKVDYLVDIIRAIHGRGFLIRDAIEWAKFQAGG